MFWDEFVTIKNELDQFEDYFQSRLDSEQPLIRKAISDLAIAGGKRVRPALIMITAHLGDYKERKVWDLAVAIEILHMATLVHDDIVDEANLRRSSKTVQAKYGKDIAVFTGDYLFSLVFNLLADYANKEELKKVTEVISKICEGEVQQYQDRYKCSLSYKSYYQRIKRKTALLFESSCALGAGAAGFNKLEVSKLSHYGRYLGMAFQLTDDLLDFKAKTDKLGKPNANDFTQGVYTMPILYVLRDEIVGYKLRELLENPEANNQQIKKMVAANGGFEYTFEIAKKYITKAKKRLRCFNNTEYKKALIGLADKVLDRKF